MKSGITITTILAAYTSSVYARTFTVHNSCSYTVWPAIFTDLNVGSAKPFYPTGWEAKSGSSVSFTVPDNWAAGRIWGRRECNFSGASGASTCKVGGCTGGLECTSTGAPPLTAAEFTLGGTEDYYDVTVVDGFNVPIAITNNKKCPEASCSVDLNAICPAALKGPVDASGATIGCKSACLVDPLPSNSSACCSGAYNTPATCPASGVPYYSFFKSNCPKSFAYPYDDASATPALLLCPSSQKADYTITFCP